MGQFILAVILLLALAQNADAQTMSVELPDGDYVRLAQDPCAATVLAHLREQVHGQYKAAAVRTDGKVWTACWRMRPDAPAVLVVFEDGDYMTVPLAAFKPPDREARHLKPSSPGPRTSAPSTTPRPSGRGGFFYLQSRTIIRP